MPYGQTLRLSISVACALVFPACNLEGVAGNSPLTDRVVGFIWAAPFGGLVGVIDGTPSTVTVGNPFPITVNTFGSSSRVHQDGASVSVVGLIAEITPYDRIPRLGSQTPCTTDFGAHPRTLTLQFAVAGQATLRVIGRSVGATGSEVTDTVEATTSVVP